MTLNPPGQYADDRHLRAWQRFWLFQDPQFDIVNWVLDLAGPSPGMRVLDAGCGNGLYLRDRRVTAVGCDLSPGMLRAAAHEAAGHLAAGHPAAGHPAAGRPAVLNADVTALPLGDGAVDVALAIHMLYHVPDRPAALRELRRVTAPGGLVVAGGHPRRGRGRRLRGQPGHPPSGRDRPPLAGRRG